MPGNYLHPCRHKLKKELQDIYTLLKLCWSFVKAFLAHKLHQVDTNEGVEFITDGQMNIGVNDLTGTFKALSLQSRDLFQSLGLPQLILCRDGII